MIGVNTESILSGRLHAWADLQADRTLPPRAPGVYAWFFRTVPSGVPVDGCVVRDGLTLLYVGISPGSHSSSETLRQRIRYHFRGNSEGSTLRLTLGVLLEGELGTVLRLECSPIGLRTVGT